MDSLKKLLDIYYKEDTLKVNLLNRISFAYWNIDPAKAESYAKEALELSKELNYKKGVGVAYLRLSTSYWIRGEYNKALDAALSSIKIYTESGNLSGIASGYEMMGLIYDEQGNFADAVKYHQKALEINSTLNHLSGISSSLNNIGAIYYKQKKFEESLDHFQKSLTIRETLNDQLGTAEVINNIGRIYLDLGNFEKALVNLQKALRLKKELNDIEGMIVSLENIGEVFDSQKDFHQAENYYQKALTLANQIGIKKWQLEIYEKLKDLEKQKGNYAKALHYYEEYLTVKDSMFNETKSRQISELQTKYETEKKEHEIEVLQRDKEINNLWLNIFGIGLAAALILAFLIYGFYRYRNKKNLQLYEKLREIDKMKSRFFANISHEFRTPLTLILGPIENMINETNNGKNLQLLNMMKQNAIKLLKLINQLLSLSKIESGKLELQASFGNIVPFAKGIVMSFESLAEKKGILLTFQSEEDDFVLYYEQDKIEQVLTNLLSNAFKFTQKNGKISIVLSRIEMNRKSFLEIMVKDTGIGISKDQLPYIFDRFFQADISYTKESEGTGIGLAITKEYVELHKGFITVESEKNKGTAFCVFLPFGKEHLKDEEIISLSSLQNNKTEDESEKLTENYINIETDKEDGTVKPLILIVEDNDDLRLYMKSTLSEEYETAEAANGKEGIEKAFELIPDIIISDIMMPKINGIELCRNLKSDEKTSHIPIILLTAKNSDDDKLISLESKADDFLVKPFNTKELNVRIRNLIEIRKKLHEKYANNIILKPKEIQASSMEKIFLEKLMEILEQYIGDETFNVEQLSSHLNMSRSQLHRKLQSLTNFTPSQFIRRFRLQRAMDLLKKNAGTVSEIAYTVGFSSPTYFTKCFIQEYGYPPKEVKTQSSVSKSEIE